MSVKRHDLSTYYEEGLRGRMAPPPYPCANAVLHFDNELNTETILDRSRPIPSDLDLTRPENMNATDRLKARIPSEIKVSKAFYRRLNPFSEPMDGKVIADPKVVSAFNDTHIAQMLGYLNITNQEVALLLNFKEATLAWKWVVRGRQEKKCTTDGVDNAEGQEQNP